MPAYRVIDGSPQDAFDKLRTKVQIFGGGYGNGKTAAAIVRKILPVAKEYPGANILVARSTYPKLNDTIRKEFLKWCPPHWIKSFPRSKNSDNTCTMVNGTTINFRYIQQQGKAVSEGEGTTSNLLSATYDLIVVDQIEDPEITHKDLIDLMGRLRGNAKYVGNDPTMPRTGPRWIILTLNPTRNWVFRKVIQPYQIFMKTGRITEDLLVLRYPRDLPNGMPHPQAGQPVLDEEGNVQLLMSLVEGSTYTNSHNLGEDFIALLESAYTGQTGARYLHGEWASYEGLVHPIFSEDVHCIPQSEMFEYYHSLVGRGWTPTFLEGYDFGIVEPSCYLAAFVDRFNNIMVFDGFYMPEKDLHIEEQQAEIWRIRNNIGIEDEKILADPAVFKRTQVTKRANSKTIAELFGEGKNSVRMRAADNEILPGITKVNMYLNPMSLHRHPLTLVKDAPHLYIATELEFVANEFTSYFWETDATGQRIDKPNDKNDHAMNTLKYMLCKQPTLAVRVPKPREQSHLHKWLPTEDRSGPNRSHRYG